MTFAAGVHEALQWLAWIVVAPFALAAVVLGVIGWIFWVRVGVEVVRRAWTRAMERRRT